MIPIDLAAVAELTGGRLERADPATRVDGPVVVDSRRVEPGSLFVCLRGERVDGHAFAGAALDAGAAAVVAEREVEVPHVRVGDAQLALAGLARGVRARVPSCRVVGVTGSSGKTTTKDLLADVLAAAGPLVAPEGSFNNEVGLPLTVLRVTPETRTLVLEYSARGVGHIRYLCGVVAPDVAVVLNVGAAHLGEFGSREAIAQAKGELVEAVPATGVAVLNADDPLVAGMRSRTAAQVVTFGAAPGADVRVEDLVLDAQARPRFVLAAGDERTEVALQLRGEHMAYNAAAAAAAALTRGLALDVVAERLRAARPRSAHRMAVTTRPDGVTVVDDAYNANPESMAAALRAVAGLSGARRWAVLGEMRELGPDAERLHREVGEAAARLGFDHVVAVGAEPIAAGARAVPGWRGEALLVADAAEATRLLAERVRGDDIVLVKASNAARLWEVAEALVPAAAGTQQGVGS